MTPNQKINIGSLVKLNKEYIAVDEWLVRGYDNLVGIVAEELNSDEEYLVYWQSNKYHNCTGDQENSSKHWPSELVVF